MIKKFNDNIDIKEKDNSVVITIESERLKPLLTAIKSYDVHFDIDDFIANESAKESLINLLIERFADELDDLVACSKYNFYDIVATKNAVNDDLLE